MNATDRRLHYLTLSLIALTIAAAFAWSWYTVIDIRLTAIGIARPRGGPARVVANATGRIRRVQVREGAQVHEGDVLVQFDTREFMRKRAALLASLQKTQTAGLYGRLHEVELALNDLTITSPAAGRVTSLVPMRVGETLHAGAVIGVITPPAGDLVIEAWLPPAERSKLSLGTAVRIEDEEVFDGVVESIQSERIVITASGPLLPGTRYPIHFITRHERIAEFLLERARALTGWCPSTTVE